MKLDSALRVYVDPGAQTVRVAADFRFDQSRRGCFHLHFIATDGTMQWIQHREGDYVLPITLIDFTSWLLSGGLREVSPLPGIGENEGDMSEEVTR